MSFQVAQAKRDSAQVAVRYLLKDEIWAADYHCDRTAPARGPAGGRRRRLRHWSSLAGFARRAMSSRSR